MNKSNKFSPEVRELAVRLVLEERKSQIQQPRQGLLVLVAPTPRA